MENIHIEITSDGTCMAIWKDQHGFDELGDLEVTRLSDVEFDNEVQGWRVHFRNGVTLPGVYKERIRALAAEMRYVEDHLSEFADWLLNQSVSMVYDPSMS